MRNRAAWTWIGAPGALLHEKQSSVDVDWSTWSFTPLETEQPWKWIGAPGALLHEKQSSRGRGLEHLELYSMRNRAAVDVDWSTWSFTPLETEQPWTWIGALLH